MNQENSKMREVFKTIARATLAQYLRDGLTPPYPDEQWLEALCYLAEEDIEKWKKRCKFLFGDDVMIFSP